VILELYALGFGRGFGDFRIICFWVRKRVLWTVELYALMFGRGFCDFRIICV
jgi:hypothetical protein